MEEGGQFNLIIGNCSLPIDIHTLAVDETGMGGQRRDFNFRFSYRQLPFVAKYRSEGKAGSIELKGDLGPMPFSAESALARSDLQMVLDAANAHLGPTLLVVGGRIALVGMIAIAEPVTAVGLVTGLARFLLTVKPYLEIIEVFLRPPGETAETGAGALRPAWREPPRKRRG